MSLTSECARSSAATPPDADADTITQSRQAFCLMLKAARERRGLSIAAIAERTKVCPSHFEALERGDLRHWPGGLFRRAFFRGYVETVGLPVASTLEEFVRFFGETASGAHTAARSQPAADAPRLVLDVSWRGATTPIVRRVAAATIDACAVIVIPGVLAWASSLHPATAVALAAVAYFTLATATVGESPASWLLRRLSGPAHIERRPVTEPAPAPSATDESDAAFRVGKEDAWTTNARRVRPRYVQPRMRVRFKWS